MRNYELMVILDPELEERTVAPSLDTYLNVVRNDGGTVDSVDVWGRRRLAYEIDGHREGHYYLLYFNAPADAITELWQEYHLNEDLVRFITLKAEKVMDKIEFKSLEEPQ